MARVSDVWKDGQWNSTPSSSGDLVAILAGMQLGTSSRKWIGTSWCGFCYNSEHYLIYYG